MSEVIDPETAVQVAEQINEVAEDLVEYVEIVRSNPVLLAGAVTIGILAGGVGGYFIAKKRLSIQFDEELDRQNAETREFFSTRYHKVDPVTNKSLSPDDVMRAQHGDEAADALQTYQGNPPDMDEQESLLLERTKAKVEVTQSPVDGTIMTTTTQHTEVVETPGPPKDRPRYNTFMDPKFDYDAEVALRTPDKPYIITQEEFYAAETDFESEKLTWFEADSTLVNDQDKPVDDIEGHVGEENLERIGAGSKDKNVVHIRNEKLQTDYEVTRSYESFLEALGLGPEPGELKHSSERRRAFRHGEG